MRLERLIERRIARHLIKALLDAGLDVAVYDPTEDEFVLPRTTDRIAIFKVMHKIDETIQLIAFIPKSRSKKGWVAFIWGNGSCCISDYHFGLEGTLKPVNQMAERLAELWEL